MSCAVMRGILASAPCLWQLAECSQAASGNGTLARIAVNLMTSEETLRGMVETAAANAPLQAHLNISIMGRGGATAATIGSVKDDMPGRLINHASMLIGGTAPFVHQALERAKTR